MKKLESTNYYEIIYNDSEQVFELWVLIVNLEEKIYPVNWRWHMFSHLHEQVVRQYRRNHFPEHKLYFEK